MLKSEDLRFSQNQHLLGELNENAEIIFKTIKIPKDLANKMFN